MNFLKRFFGGRDKQIKNKQNNVEIENTHASSSSSSDQSMEFGGPGCPKCGGTGQVVAGAVSDSSPFVQYACDKCGHSWMG